ncbi:MerR family DNA-binding transcriptional regulator [Paenibacillus lutimineralis]|uniref:MerR family DNA-binding transcriptional regulator n=1 Tax=Paenibacillus lutimineralis TaxID=2707005 RepID=A0A3S9V2B1_9BACL|nr:MerR family DNA-binding transcriptional regulator [Paenibacillus lutimineralis]AZS16742.1 MerR family DNA-binding transcriptional regulator [Paenibacillus lutimineralis]
MKSKMRPVDIARMLNISTSSLRNYEAKGLVPTTERLATGYRVYTKEHIAYFECITAMAPGFGMEITSTVLKKIQVKELDSALWLINKAQAINYENKVIVGKALRLLETPVNEQTSTKKQMTIGEISRETEIAASTLRYWEKEGLINATREDNNNYRMFDRFQMIKILLMKTNQNAVYSYEVTHLKEQIKTLNDHDYQSLKRIVNHTQNHLEDRNKIQLHGLYYLYRLCSMVNLY